jgi:hypothetical protein
MTQVGEQCKDGKEDKPVKKIAVALKTECCRLSAFAEKLGAQELNLLAA